MTIAFGNALSKTYVDDDTKDPSQARAELEAIIDRLNTKLVNKTLLEIGDKTGADAKVVSGTAGTNGNLGQWNADGDMVDGPDVLDEDDMASDSASAVPTQQSAKAYVDDKSPVDLQSGSLSSDASEIVLSLPSGYQCFEIDISRFSPVDTGGRGLLLQFSTDGGTTWATGYDANTIAGSTGDPLEDNSNTGTNELPLMTGAGINQSGDQAGRHASGRILIYEAEGAIVTRALSSLSYNRASDNALMNVHSVGERKAEEAHDAVRILYSAGNIEAGSTYRMRGYK